MGDWATYFIAIEPHSIFTALSSIYLQDTLRRTFKAAGFKEPDYPHTGKPCPGFTWKHGHTPCSSETILSFEIAGCLATHAGKKIFRNICYTCSKISRKIEKWIMSNRVGETGDLICNAIVSCTNKALTGDFRFQFRIKLFQTGVARSRAYSKELYTWNRKVKSFVVLRYACGL
jgi:hypothetical protein